MSTTDQGVLSLTVRPVTDLMAVKDPVISTPQDEFPCDFHKECDWRAVWHVIRTLDIGLTRGVFVCPTHLSVAVSQVAGR